MRMSVSSLLLAVGLVGVVLSFQACGRMPSSGFNQEDLGESQLGSSLDLRSQALNVLEKNCASCHNPTYSSGTSLNMVHDLDQLAASSYVVPGDPMASGLYTDIANGYMPPGAPLGSDQARIIYDWIVSLSPGATPTPAPTLTPTPTPSSTVTPAPTATPRPGATPTPNPTPTPTPVNLATFTYINANILQPKCVSCHGTSGGYSYANYTATLRSVVPGNPNASLLYTETASGSMPKRTRLTTQEVDLIRSWIQAGALNN